MEPPVALERPRCEAIDPVIPARRQQRPLEGTRRCQACCSSAHRKAWLSEPRLACETAPPGAVWPAWSASSVPRIPITRTCLLSAGRHGPMERQQPAYSGPPWGRTGRSHVVSLRQNACRGSGGPNAQVASEYVALAASLCVHSCRLASSARCDEENGGTKATRCSVGGLPLTRSWIRWRELGPELLHGLHQRAPIALGLVLVVVVHDHMYVEAGPAELLDLMP